MAFVPSTVPVVGRALGEESGGSGQPGADDFPETASSCAAVTSPETAPFSPEPHLTQYQRAGSSEQTDKV